MPMLIYTIGDYFALYKKDFYLITFKRATEDNWEDLPERNMIMDWFRENLPETKIFHVSEVPQPGLFSAEYKGGIGIEFDKSSLTRFVERWEDNTGTSIDPNFQCYVMSLDYYIEQFGSEILDINYNEI
ncbi:hypothetical protein BKG93_08500 [Rodentibacter ratti]|uniref:Uncharacterized protein n=1 Tax=Rodentibacter ratti TaxID=1906745 RepID=A0A1V3L2P1_9PAST|nr:hypothetical protein [Rodentibacter ratti]OOF84199.1 hypothetical protein BKG93_08500 [Rodentibacter ratti]